MNLDVADDGERLTPAVGIKPEIRAASATEMPQGSTSPGGCSGASGEHRAPDRVLTQRDVGRSQGRS